MKRKFMNIAVDMTGNGVGDDIFGSFMQRGVLSRMRNAPEDLSPAQAFGGNTSPKLEEHKPDNSSSDLLSDFDSWGLDFQQNPPAKPSVSAQTPNSAVSFAQSAPTGSPTPNAQGATVQQDSSSRAESPSELHPAVGEFEFSSTNAKALMDHYSTAIPADLFSFSAEDQQKIASGDFSPMAAKSAALQKTLAQAMAVAVSDAITLVENKLKPALSKSFEAYTNNTKRTASMEEATGGFDRGSLKFLAKSVAEQYLRENPRATPAQVKEATNKFVNGLKQVFSGEVSKANNDQSTDWTKFLQ